MTLVHVRCKTFSQVSHLACFCLGVICLQHFKVLKFKVCILKFDRKTYRSEIENRRQIHSQCIMQSNEKICLSLLSKNNKINKTTIHSKLMLLQPTTYDNFPNSPTLDNLMNLTFAPNCNIVNLVILFLVLLLSLLSSLYICTSVHLHLLLPLSKVLYFYFSSFHWCKSCSLDLCYFDLNLLERLLNQGLSGKHGVG